MEATLKYATANYVNGHPKFINGKANLSPEEIEQKIKRLESFCGLFDDDDVKLIEEIVAERCRCYRNINEEQ